MLIRTRILFAVLTSAAVLVAAPARAQFGVNAQGVNAAFIKLFGPHTNFTAKVDVQVLDKAGKDWLRLPGKIAALEEKLRFDVDMGRAVSKELPEFAINSLKQSGMNEVISIVRPDRKATFLIYPGAQSYLNLPLSADDAAAMQKGYKVETASSARETLQGKERVRSNVVVREAAGNAVLTATTWTAPELKNFPVQIETKQDNMTIILRFADLQLLKPAASQFELPAGFTEYQDMQKMMFGIMKKMVSGTPGD